MQPLATLLFSTLICSQAPTPAASESATVASEPTPAASESASAATEPASSAEPRDTDTPVETATPAPQPAPAPAPSFGAQQTLDYADHLFVDGDYYRSISEYRRFLYLVKGRDEQAPRAALAIGEALLRGEQYDAAGRQLDGVAQRTSSLTLRHTALFGAARAYLLDGRPELAKPRFRLLVQDEQTPQALQKQAKWLLAWGHFDAGELEIAVQYFRELAKGRGKKAKQAGELADAIEAVSELPQKSPVLAGLLSALPGGGHFYLGQWATGTTSLIWNGLFIFAAVSAFLGGDWGVGIVLSIFELGWYAGSIFGAVSGTYRYNRDVIRNWRDGVLADYGQGRSIPEDFIFRGRNDAPPGTLIRFGGRF